MYAQPIQLTPEHIDAIQATHRLNEERLRLEHQLANKSILRFGELIDGAEYEELISEYVRFRARNFRLPL